MEERDFAEFFEQEIKERRNKIFKTKKRLATLIRNEIQDAEEDTDGTAIQNSNDNVEDILNRNSIEYQDILLEKVIFNFFLHLISELIILSIQIRFFFDFRMPSLVNCRKLLASITKNCKFTKILQDLQILIKFCAPNFS